MKGELLQILLIEDNDDHAELLSRALQVNRVINRIHRVADGEAAVDYLFRQGPDADLPPSSKPNLILLDLRLPKVDGVPLRSSRERMLIR